jgi:hypothetical protein
MPLRQQGSVLYLGFSLTPDRIKQGWSKLKAIRDSKPPTDVKTIWSFLGLCKFFCPHIKNKNFAIIFATPLFKLTHKDSGYKGRELAKETMESFSTLKNQLTSEPMMAFPHSDRKYALITDAATSTADSAGGLGTILSKMDSQGCFYAISFASGQLKDHKKNYSPFFLEAFTADWGMDI